MRREEEGVSGGGGKYLYHNSSCYVSSECCGMLEEWFSYDSWSCQKVDVRGVRALEEW